MNSRTTWNWIVLAAALFAFIFFFERHWRREEPGLQPMLPGFKGSSVTSIQVRPAGQLEIRADRTNRLWVLTRPVVYPAQTTAVEALLTVLERLAPAGYISARELRQRPKFDEEYGFTAPQISLTIQQGEGRSQILFGARTAPGDQVFVQVVGMEGVYVMDAELLKLLPRKVDQWRDTALVDLQEQACDRLIITNGIKIIELQHNPATGLWSLTRPIPARADSSRINESLQQLLGLQVLRFITNEPGADWESYGLQPPELTLALAHGTNTIAQVDFGKSPTNAASLVYARRGGLNSVAVVSNAWLAPWLVPVSDLRDHRLVSFSAPITRIEVRDADAFMLQRRSSNSWQMVPTNFPVDAGLANDFSRSLAELQIVQFKDAVTESDLPAYGLTNPVRQIQLTAAGDDPHATNAPVLLSFGAVQEDKIFVRRSDEDSVYAVPLEGYQQLPTAAWQLRERRLWHFTEEEVAYVTVREGGRTREVIRHGSNSWSLASGSQGVVNGPAVEEVVHRFGELTATLWNAPGGADLAPYGFGTNQLSYEFELKNGEKLGVEFGSIAPSQYPYAAVEIEGRKWVFEFSVALYQFARMYLTLPPETP